MMKKTKYIKYTALFITLITLVSAFIAIFIKTKNDYSNSEDAYSNQSYEEYSAESSENVSSEIESEVPDESDETSLPDESDISIPDESQDENSVPDISEPDVSDPETSNPDVSVDPEFIDVTRIEFESSTIEIDLNTITPIVVNVYPENATNKEYTLTSSDEAILKVMLTNVMGTRDGEVTLTATSVSNPEVSATCKVIIGKGAEEPHTCSFSASKTVEATCTDKGYTIYKCSCGVTENRDYIEALGHNEGEWKVITEATTTTNGLKRKSCTRCGVTLAEEEIDKLVEDPDAKYMVPATADNAKLVEERILYYLNLYRVQDGVQEATALLDGKTYQYAKMRAAQLVDNFAHDMDDIREIATELEFGYYHPESPESYYDFEKDEVVYTGNIIPAYYNPGFSEAITEGYSNYSTVDGVAKEIAKACYNSEAHWSYVGASTTKHITVGAYLSGGYWWEICIATSGSNEYD